MSVTLDDLRRIYDEVIPIKNEHGLNGRFDYAKVRRLDKWFFVKIAISPEYWQGLENESLWSEFMERVDVLSPGMKLQGPHIVQKIGHDALVFEYIDAPMVAVRGDATAWRAHVDRYADMLVKLDTLSGSLSLSHIYTKLNHPYDLNSNLWQKWVVGTVAPEIIKQARKIFKDYERHVSVRMQHNDMSPWQIFDKGDTWVIIDGEMASLNSPRFQDVSQSYARMWTDARDESLAREFLSKVIAGTGMGQDDFLQQFYPVITMHSVGFLADSLLYPALTNYATEAQALVDLCLGGDPKELLP